MKAQERGYQGVKTVAPKPAGGYCLVPARSLLAAWHAHTEGFITLFDLRAWLASWEMQARRCQMAEDRVPDYTLDELAALLGCHQVRKVRHAVAQLASTGLLQWHAHRISLDTEAIEHRLAEETPWTEMLALVKNNTRRVPLPRRIIRYVVRTRSKTLIGTVLAYLLRALYSSKRMCISGGRCKVSWIAAVFHLDPRNVKMARRTLMENGWLQASAAPQQALNRWGLPVTINLSWREPVRKSLAPPPQTRNTAKPPPPYDNKKLSTRLINQKPCQTSGVQTPTLPEKPPGLRHITRPDLTAPDRLDVLFRQAVRQGMLPATESSRLQWHAAGAHALSHGKQNPCGLFAALLKRRLWPYITQSDEDTARAKLKLLDFGESVQPTSRPVPPLDTAAKAA